MATVALGSGKQTGDFLLWSARGFLCVCSPRGAGSKHSQGQTAPAGQGPPAPGPSTHPEQGIKGNKRSFFPEFILNIPELPIQACSPRGLITNCRPLSFAHLFSCVKYF